MVVYELWERGHPARILCGLTLEPPGEIMSKFIFAIVITGLSFVVTSAQVKTSATTGQPRELAATSGTPGAGRERVLGSTAQRNLSSPSLKDATSARGDAPVNNLPNTGATKTRPRFKNEPSTAPATAASSMVPSQIYRIGTGDVLDVQLVDVPTTKSTLFTVLDGVLEYPLAGDPLRVVGLTADEIASHLQARIRVFENPRVIVKVRDYASHNVTISGLVADPGAKFLRREALPFYVLLAEAQPRPEAARATISRSGQPTINIDLNDQQATATLVQAGDVIKVLGPSTQPAEYFYVSGAINSPGQRVFHSGMTLTQAIIVSGEMTRVASGKIKISRQATDGRLITTEYNLRQIQNGKTPDPSLQPGDRISVSESH